jgi:hypothetical protein
MELIPIIKFALTIVSGLSLVIVGSSYILYKVKRSKKSKVIEESFSLVPAGNNSFTPKPTAKRQERSLKYKVEKVNEPQKRFVVINEVAASPKMSQYSQDQTIRHLTDDPNPRHSLNILYSNYSVNDSEPLKKFGV